MTLAGARLGRESASRGEVDDFQRARIVSAMVEVASELGYVGAAVAPVVARAGVSRRTFYELFEGREECFLAAFDWGVAQMRQVMVEAYGSQRAWRDRVRHALAALLGLLDAEPELARMCVIEALGAGKLVLRRRAQILDELIASLGADTTRPRGAVDAPPLLTAEGIVGGAFSVIHGRLLELGVAEAGEGSSEDDDEQVKRSEGQASAIHGSASSKAEGAVRMPGPLIELHGQLMALIALPYLGPSVAGKELTRAAPEQPPRDLTRARDEDGDGQIRGGRLLERLNMRLTYRTVRCLLFIGEHPGVSNREIARGAEIPDEGQASKLLGRLVKLELIANGQAHGPGLPNRWMLTPRGKQVLGAVRGR